MFSSRSLRGVFALGLVVPVCAAPPLAALVRAELSPPAEHAGLREAWHQAEAFAAARPGREIVVGRGDSMLPLYRDRTVLVLEPMEMAAWRAGMTVVFIGDQGRPVAHTLVRKTLRGWIACGLANPESDRTLVRAGNYLGTVVRAFTPHSERLAAASISAAAGGE